MQEKKKNKKTLKHHSKQNKTKKDLWKQKRKVSQDHKDDGNKKI